MRVASSSAQQGTMEKHGCKEGTLPKGVAATFARSKEEERLGALGGFAGFHGIVEVLMSELGCFEASLPDSVFGNNDNAPLEVGPAAGV